MGVTVLNKPKHLDEKILSLVTAKAFLFLGKELDIGLRFVTEREMTQLNKSYRGIDKPTNVLAFEVDKNIGDIVISSKVVLSESRELGYKKNELILLYFVHGILHLAGFSHENSANRAKMESAEEKILSDVNINIKR